MNPTLAKAAANLKRRAKSAALPAVWLMSDEARMPDPVSALAALPRGSAVILRHYGSHDRVALAHRLARACRKFGMRLIVAGDWRLAARVDAAGLHLAEHAARRGAAPGARLWLRRKSRILSVAAHGPAGIARGGKCRAAAVLLSPVFPTASHPGRQPLAQTGVAAMTRTSSVPVIGLGGITARTIARLSHSGCAGIAGIGFALTPDRL